MDSLNEMMHKTKVSAAGPSLLLLNEYCLLEIYEFLKLDDSIKLAMSCSRLRFVADRMLKKYSNFRLDLRNMIKGKAYIEHILSYIGKHVSSLILKWHISLKTVFNMSEIIGTISNDCKNLECLCIKDWNGEATENVTSVYNFDNVKKLTLINCNFDFVKSFVLKFNKLKAFNIYDCYIEPQHLKTVFENNPNIESFLHINQYAFNLQLLQIISNVERLCLGSYHDIQNISELNLLLKLNRLTKLELLCNHKNINNFLRELKKKGIIEEMKLFDVETDDDFFDILTSFDKLQLLVIRSAEKTKLKSSIAWPTTVKRLRLRKFQLTCNDFMAMIQQLQSLENIDLMYCDIEDSYESDFNYVEKLSERILHTIDLINRKQRLDVVLPRFTPALRDSTKKCLINSKPLRMLHCPDEHNPLGIAILFPGYDYDFYYYYD